MRSLAMLAIAAISGAAMAQFTEGNLVVSVIGDGGETANNQPVFLREFTTAGASVGSDLSLTNIGGRHVTTTYGETSEAQLVRSGNGMYLTIPGYDLEPHNLTTFSVYDTPRVVARINNAKVVGFSTNFSIYDPITFKGDGVRCAYSSTGDDYLVTGGDGGIMKGTSFATNPTHYFAGDYSSRTITRWGGQVYYNGSNAYFGGNGLATWDETPNFPVPIFAAAGSSRDFEVYSPTVIYVAHSTNAVGLVKYVFDGSNWNEAYRVGGAGLNSIAADFSGSQPTFYVTSSNGENLFKIVDLGTAFSSRETIAVAAAGTRFRGIDWAPNVYENATSAVTTVEGEEFEGDLSAIQASDDVRYCAFNDPNTLGCKIEVSGQATVPTISELRFKMEYSVARPGLSIGLGFYNYSTGTFNLKYGATAVQTDTEVNTTSAPTNYVNTSKAMRALISFSPINDEDPSQDGWLHCLDVAQWLVKA